MRTRKAEWGTHSVEWVASCGHDFFERRGEKSRGRVLSQLLENRGFPKGSKQNGPLPYAMKGFPFFAFCILYFYVKIDSIWQNA